MNVYPQQIGKYALRSLSGRAGIVEIWHALDTQSRLDVNIKLFRPDSLSDPDFIRRFEQEARSVATLHHPNIVQVRDFQVVNELQSTDKVACLVVDSIAGQPLVDYLHVTSGVRKFPPWETVVQIFSAICAATDYAHRQGVIHRNINPTNILLNTRNTSHNSVGEPMLTDFGIAAILGVTSSPRPGGLQGNPHYLAPEQLQGYRGNELSDIYSLGVILYQICTGVLPFQEGSNSSYAVSEQRADSTPQPPGLFNPAIPPPLTLVLLRSLTKDPTGRYTTATAMANALAEALNIFLPDNSPVSAISAIDALNLPTYLTPAPQNTSPGRVPSDLPDLQTLVPAKSNRAFPSPTKPRRRWRGLILALIAIVILLSASLSIGAFYVFHQNNTSVTSPTGPTVVGHAFFVSSGHVNRNTNQGLNDGLQLAFQKIAAPAPGKSYYAWLLNDTGTGKIAFMLLGQLPVVHGTAHLSYKDGRYTNLLAIFDRLLITEESASTPPVAPSQDKSTWKYSAVLAQTNTLAAKYDLLDNLRYLLSGEPKLDALGLHGGLTIWFAKNIEALTVWAGSARDYWKSTDASAVRPQLIPQLIRILDVLDSASYVRGDVPAGTSLQFNAPVALLTIDAQNQAPQSYLYQIDSNLKAIINAPGATSAQIQLATKIRKSLDHIINWLKQVRKDAMQLLQLSDTQLLSQTSLSILNDMAAQSLYAYVGQLDPATNQIVQGAVQIYDNIERLATFDITMNVSRQG